MKKLFLSFSTLLGLVAEGKVSAAELSDGLFFFGCWKEHVLDPDCLKIYTFDGKSRASADNRYREAQASIAQAVVQAEAAGRAEWHNGQRRAASPWALLNKLFDANGLPPVGAPTNVGDYSYPAVRDAVTAKKLSLDPVY